MTRIVRLQLVKGSFYLTVEVKQGLNLPLSLLYNSYLAMNFVYKLKV